MILLLLLVVSLMQASLCTPQLLVLLLQLLSLELSICRCILKVPAVLELCSQPLKAIQSVGFMQLHNMLQSSHSAAQQQLFITSLVIILGGTS
jgi:hypothetical protein